MPRKGLVNTQPSTRMIAPSRWTRPRRWGANSQETVRRTVGGSLRAKLHGSPFCLRDYLTRDCGRFPRSSHRSRARSVQQLGQRPRVASAPGCHRGRSIQGRVQPAVVVVRDVQAGGYSKGAPPLSRRDGRVAVDPLALGNAALAGVEVVDRAALVDGDLSNPFDIHVAGVAGGGAASVVLLVPGHGWEAFARGPNWVPGFSNVFTNGFPETS
jgi:hypothetical protein